MNRLELNINNSKIKLYGTNNIINNDAEIIESLELTGNEYKDRLLIQKAIDKYKLKSDILYNGNIVYPFEKTVKNYRKLQKSGSLDKLNKYMYNFFTNACGDIAHYNIEGFKSYYDYSFMNLETSLLKHDNFLPLWHSDLDRIFKELKIGKYYDDREKIDLNQLSLNQLKNIIYDCNWEVIDDKETWKIHKKMIYGINYSFNIKVSNKNIFEIIDAMNFYNNYFNESEYAELLFENRKNNLLDIGKAVDVSKYVRMSLNDLITNVKYKCRNLIDENDYKKNKNLDMGSDIIYEI